MISLLVNMNEMVPANNINYTGRPQSQKKTIEQISSVRNHKVSTVALLERKGK